MQKTFWGNMCYKKEQITSINNPILKIKQSFVNQ